MNSYEIKNIRTLLNGEDVTAVIFQMLATDENAEVAETTRHIAMPEPFESEVSYSAGDLLALCEAEAEDKGVKAFLDNVLVLRNAPPIIISPPDAPSPPAEPVVPAPVIPLTDAEQRAVWVADVDNRIADMLTKFTRFQMGYSKRLEAAEAFKAAGYVGDPTIWITSFADAAGVTNQQSADSVLAKAAEYDLGLEQLEAIRMDKYRILSAATMEDASVMYYDIISRATVVDNGLS